VLFLYTSAARDDGNGEHCRAREDTGATSSIGAQGTAAMTSSAGTHLSDNNIVHLLFHLSRLTRSYSMHIDFLLKLIAFGILHDNALEINKLKSLYMNSSTMI
jgi:hypothetical protein